MKKSIFLFFAAILSAMSANAACYLKGGFNGWSEANPMAVSGTTATCTIDLAGCTTFEFKVNNGSSWHGSSSTVTSTETTITLNGGDNAKITTTIPGTYTFSFNTSTQKLTVTYPTAPAPHDITVRAQVPASWTNTITAWVWTSENGTGEEVNPTKDGDYYVVTKNAGALYVIFKNGAGWNGDNNQTVDLCYTEDVCLQLNQSGEAKATATVIDCGAVAKDITIKAVVPGAWENEITAWVWPTGGAGEEVTPTKEGNWYVITKNCIELNVIFKNGTGWNGDENQTVDIEGVSENICYQISALTKVGNKCSVAEVDCDAVIEPEAKPEPTPTYDYYVIGTINNWGLKDAAYGMTDDDADGVYEKVITLADGKNQLKINKGEWKDGEIWGYDQLAVEYEGVSRGTNSDDNNIIIDITPGKDITVKFDKNTSEITLDGLTEKAPVVLGHDYYITGSFNGNNPADEAHGMTLDGTVYKATVTLAAGDNTLKVTKGSWDPTWGYTELGAAYKEVSDAGEYNNIKITLAEEKEITVIFDATGEGKITFDGLTENTASLTYTVKVPWGTETCYIATSATGWNFKPMNQNPDDDRLFSVDIVGAKETDEYKYALLADWDFAEVRENNRTTWAAQDNVTSWNKPTYTVAGDVALCGVNWEADNYDNQMECKDNYETYVWHKGALYFTENVGFKVVKNSNWDLAYPADNVVLEIGEDKTNKPGYYTVTITYKRSNNNVTFELTPQEVQKATLSFDNAVLTEREVEGTAGLEVNANSEDWLDAVQLFLKNYNGENKEYELSTESQVTYQEANTRYLSASGTVEKSVDANTGLIHFNGKINAIIEQYNNEKEWFDATPYEFTLNLIEIAPLDVTIENATVSLNDATGYLTLTSTFTLDDVTYPTTVNLAAFESLVANKTYNNPQGGELQMGDDYVWLDFAITNSVDVSYNGNTIQLKGKFISYSGAIYNVTISGTIPSVQLDGGDNSTVISNNAGKLVMVEMDRTFATDDGYYTLCVPFDIMAYELGTVHTISSVTKAATEGFNVNFSEVETIKAGYPYLLEPSVNLTSPKFVVNLKNVAAQTSSASGQGLSISMNGVLTTTGTETTDGLYWVGNQGYLYNDDVAKLSLRSYFTITSASSVAPRMRVVTGENVETGVEDIIATDAPVKVIENGQLIIIRDGVKYNVQGQLVK